MPVAVEVNLAYAFRILDLQRMPLSHSTEHVTADDMVSNEAKGTKSCYNEFVMNRLDVTRAVPNKFVQGVSFWIKCVQMLVVGFISLALFNQILVYEVWPKTFEMLLCLQGLKVEIL